MVVLDYVLDNSSIKYNIILYVVKKFKFAGLFLYFSPRPPLPLSLIWTQEEAAQVIQSHWRGFTARRNGEIQELRQWQKDWRQENENIRNKVDDFWAGKIDDKKEDVLPSE